MRKRTLLLTNLGKPLEEANYADICLYDKENDNKIIVDPSEINSTDYPLSRFSPIGVVAVPSSHTVEKRPRICSLKDMDWDSPDGDGYGGLICFGGYGKNWISERIYEYPYLGIDGLTLDSKVNYHPNYSYLPCDDGGYYHTPLNSKEMYQTDDPIDYQYFMCSPYKEDGSLETRYFDTSNSNNVLCDFDGKTNTKKILDIDNSKSTSWQTASEISNESTNQFIHPAAQCTWRYHTDGTKQGDWYLPSCGELGYLFARYSSINRTIELLNEVYNRQIFELIDGEYFYWSSSDSSILHANGINFINGLLTDLQKTESDGYGGSDFDCLARAFLKI